MTEQQKTIYVNINEQTLALFFIAEVLGLSKYMLFLLYETFGDDCFLFFDMFNKSGLLPRLTKFRLLKCFNHAHKITPILLGSPTTVLKPLEARSYQMVLPYVYENKLKFKEDLSDDSER